MLGRNPVAIDDRTPVHVVSPSGELSRTHALIDVDDAGRIVVTDHNSGNGIVIEDTDTPLPPGQPTVIDPGATLRLGDVTLTVAVAA